MHTLGEQSSCTISHKYLVYYFYMQDKLVPHTICLKRVMASLKAVFHFMAIFLSMVHLDIGNVFPGEITVTVTNDLTLKSAHIAAHNKHDDSLQTLHALVGTGT